MYYLNHPTTFGSMVQRKKTKFSSTWFLVSFLLSLNAPALWAGRSTDRIPAEARGFSLPQIAQTGSGIHTAFYSMDSGVLSRKRSGRRALVTCHLSLVPRLRMSEAISLQPLQAFMAWIGRTLPLPSLFPFLPFYFFLLTANVYKIVGTRIATLYKAKDSPLKWTNFRYIKETKRQYTFFKKKKSERKWNQDNWNRSYLLHNQYL